MALIVGLTGGIASGKSTVSNMCKEMGIPVIDADTEAKLAVEPGERAYEEIVAAFGKGVLLPDGEIDRRALGEIVFNEEAKRLVLNSIVHPEVRRRMAEKQRAAVETGARIVILDIPLLFESNLVHLVDKILVISVDRDTQLKRLMARNDFSKEEAEARISSQMPLVKKAQLADAVINNNGPVEDTKRQLVTILHKWGME
ncbi:dephospho-CoA kinase [Neobacillus notoginsengisoli]|uniref:Dephospho-CoA kinase n=1 Tax=Neobacillus notoginsengisoli TaxID=1578198 RepID=A0A417YU93_9BACI|nr:dephospho-CoA kinase [Neobacillus notoginsengisoli]RHW40712.1 dephospho-CoA kinase [Neobacillus notoginsengisoli]